MISTVVGSRTTGRATTGPGRIGGMALEMRTRCERCETADLLPDGEAWICSYECSFCPDCAATMHQVCPNCGGELVRRPRRRTQGD
jgi:hypothetical protein